MQSINMVRPNRQEHSQSQLNMHGIVGQHQAVLKENQDCHAKVLTLLCRQDSRHCRTGLPQSQWAQCSPPQPESQLLRELPVHAGCLQQDQLQVGLQKLRPYSQAVHDSPCILPMTSPCQSPRLLLSS